MALPMSIGISLILHGDITNGVLFCILGSLWFLIMLLDYIGELLIKMAELVVKK
jgi:hypothetical protein